MPRVSHPFYLVRHGQSEWNVLRLTQGQTHHPRLTELGREQATRAAELLAEEPGVGRLRIVSSDLARAAETADIIARRLGSPITHDERLREQHLGTLEGRGYDDTWAAAEAHDWSDPSLPIAGGESLLDVHARMSAALSEHAAGDRPVVLVSHGDAIRVAVAHVAGHAPHEAPWVDVPNGAVARVDGGELTWLEPVR
jgi:probable phosphoglycerate mutase